MAKIEQVSLKLRNIYLHEALCRCGCGLRPSDVILVCLQAFVYHLERKLGRKVSVIISSMARCPSHNSHEGGVADSRHTVIGRIGDGRPDAADCRFRVSDDNGKSWSFLDSDFVAREAADSWLFGGIGWKKYKDTSKIIHLDCRPGPLATW
jgi:hypothetical protein